MRRRIGYVGQLGGADREATGRENLLLQGRLYGMSRTDTERRAGELIELLELGAFSQRIVRSYSGGQRRRLEVALGIMHRPEVLFLDEPTLGLDPQNRANLWEQLRGLRDAGTTILLTTHYLDEADQLSDRLAIIDHGRVVAEGTPLELKQRYPAEVIITPKPGPPSWGRSPPTWSATRMVGQRADRRRGSPDPGPGSHRRSGGGDRPAPRRWCRGAPGEPPGAVAGRRLPP